MRTGRPAVLATALLLGACAPGATAARAASVVILPATPAVGTSAVLLGSGFGANRTVTVRMGSTRSVVRADSAGRVDTTLRVPSRSRPGRRVLRVSSRTRRVRVVVSIALRQSTTASALAALDRGERFLIATTRAVAGARVRVRGSGLRRRVTILARVGGARAGSARASRRGRLALMAVVPAVRVGAHPLTLRGRGVSVRLPFSVLADPTTPPPPPPPPNPPPPPSPPPVVAAAGDIACPPSQATMPTRCHQASTAAAAAALNPAAVLALGDTQYESGAPAEYAAYNASWGQFNPIVFPVPGDEEYTTAGAAGYFGYFGARAGDPALGYYSYDLGAWHVIALNSVACNMSCAAQTSWLMADLAAHPAQCTLAYWHSPRFTSGTPAQATYTGAFWDALYAAGAEVVLGGNSHTYERFAPQSPARVPDPTRGIREFVVGTGGHDTEQGWGTMVRDNSEVRNSTTFGVLALTLRPGGYDWRFVPEAGAAFTDSGSGACH
jgi:hypothetical protein